jgi:hypothetical protein
MHFGTLALIIAVDKDLGRMLARGLTYGLDMSWSTDHMQTLLLIVCIAAFIRLYIHLYASDPGFLHSEGDKELLVQQRTGNVHPCVHCGCKPSIRSRHSKMTGQCVHKFDHSCFFLSTDIGDRTHGLFMLYMVFQMGWILWGLAHVVPVAVGCVASGTTSSHCKKWSQVERVMTYLSVPWLALLSIPFGYLFLLQLYLLLTNQTTIEVIKGSRLRYMAQFYDECDTKSYDLPHDAGRLFWDEIQGRGPPKPFSRGVLGNIALLWQEKWPRLHEPVSALPMESQAV